MPSMSRWQRQIVSYVLSFIVYSSLMNWKVALVLMGGIAFHEGGHLLMAHRLGMRTKGFYLWPLMGGMALVADSFKSYRNQAMVMLAGPIAGGLLTVVCYGAYLLTGWSILGGAAYWMAWVNLFNLLPIAMLDGGQLMDSVLFSVNELLGAIYTTISYAIAVFILWHFNPVIILLVVFSGIPHLLWTWKSYHARKETPELPGFELPIKMNASELAITLLVYSITAGSLYWLINYLSHQSLNMSKLLHS